MSISKSGFVWLYITTVYFWFCRVGVKVPPDLRWWLNMHSIFIFVVLSEILNWRKLHPTSDPCVVWSRPALTWSQPNTKYLCCWLWFSATHVFHPSLSYVRIMEFLEKSLRIQSYVYDWIHTVVPFVSHSQSTLWTPQPTPLSDSHLKFLEFHLHSPCSSLASSSSLVSPPRIKVLATRETNLYEIYLPGCIK